MKNAFKGETCVKKKKSGTIRYMIIEEEPIWI